MTRSRENSHYLHGALAERRLDLLLFLLILCSVVIGLCLAVSFADLPTRVDLGGLVLSLATIWAVRGARPVWSIVYFAAFCTFLFYFRLTQPASAAWTVCFASLLSEYWSYAFIIWISGAFLWPWIKLDRLIAAASRTTPGQDGDSDQPAVNARCRDILLRPILDLPETKRYRKEDHKSWVEEHALELYIWSFFFPFDCAWFLLNTVGRYCIRLFECLALLLLKIWVALSKRRSRSASENRNDDSNV